ncbi:molybdate ABC transporter substrate-binding protein [Nocardioides sp. CER19]|uniref:molybdate ABC transporter substrate-binding protein n=1 Tax=Nocardioides sp. CER19 TaxID=3038538 RepID=UPI00244BF970|nr:molybdate ABC transporter substrate-binding protein [Nocardioides sp. CER19]MDH2414952.1 molybdate ABC transporter substrate-binding protein [Nocardioides sp. CER19]
MSPRARLFLVPVLALVAPLAACGGSDDAGGSEQRTLTVFAAASLTKTFTQLGKDFEADHDGTAVRFSFGGSSDLVEQIQSGAPADVFASADTKNMDKLGNEAENRQDFASNVLEIATPPGNPAHVTSFAGLAEPGLKLVICAPEVPCGAATAQVAKNAGVTLRPVSQEQSVTDVLGKVISGEADAGVVYVTDVKGAGDSVDGVTFPESSSVVNTYPIATVKGAKNADLAKEFEDFVLSVDGQKVLADAGFGKP